MATTTQYGGAPLPELATRADALDALRRTGGGLADLQRRTQRAALGGALTFCFAGFAVLALTASPTYGPWNESPDAMETSGGVAARATLGPDDALARASSSSTPAPSSFARPAAAASFAARAEPRLGQVDSHALFEALLDAVTEAERPHLLQLLDGAQIMPDVIFQKFGELAASVAADEDGARAAHMDTLVQKLNIMTDMDVTTAHLILHFRQNADVAEEEKLEPADLAGFGTTVLAILRKYPEWSDEDARVITRATQRAEARARMNQNAAARAKTKADLGSVSGSGVSGSGVSGSGSRPRGLASSRRAGRRVPRGAERHHPRDPIARAAAVRVRVRAGSSSFRPFARPFGDARGRLRGRSESVVDDPSSTRFARRSIPSPPICPARSTRATRSRSARL